MKLAHTQGLAPLSYQLLLRSKEYLVAKIATKESFIVLKASTIPNHVSEGDAKNCLLLLDAGLPVPQVLAYGEDPVSFAFLNWIEGEPLTKESPISAQIEAGRLIMRINYLSNRPPYDREYSYDSWMEGWLNVAMTYWSHQEGVTTQMIDNVWDGFYGIRSLLATRGTQFMLQDGRPDHFMVLNGKINGIIDLHDCQPGDGAMDLAVFGLFNESLLDNALKGYEADRQEQEAIKELVPFYLFLRRLAAAEFHSKSGSDGVGQQALKLANSNPYQRQLKCS